MNAATRVISSRTISFPVLRLLPLGGRTIWFVMLSLALSASAFAIIYTKDLNRRLFIEDQQIKQQELQAEEQWTKLLLEQGSLAAQPRIQKIARNHRQMIMTSRAEIQLVSGAADTSAQ